MPHSVSIMGDVVVLSYLLWAVVQFGRDYRRLKEAVGHGDAEARPRFYRRALVLEWVSAILALIALGFDRTKLNSASLEMNHTALGQWLSSMSKDFDYAVVGGVSLGVLIGLALMIFVRLRARRRGATPRTNASISKLRRFIPDFSAFLPTTGLERLLFAAVALSAGICEEIVYRGWLLFALRDILGLTGIAAVLVAAAVFGVAHQYQGPLGVLSATLAGLLFCILYVATGTLLVPIFLHSLIDLRFAILPASNAHYSQQEI